MTNWDELSGSFADAVLKNGEGKHVFVLFFFSWCKSCMKDYPVFKDSWENIIKQYGDKVAFLKVDLDNKGDLMRYFRINHSPTFAYLGLGGAGKTIYFNKYNGKLDVNNLESFMIGKCN